MSSQITASEHAAFAGAAADAIADPASAVPIATMMRLSTEGENRTVARWAAVWLKNNCGIRVVFAEDEEACHAAPPETANLR